MEKGKDSGTIVSIENGSFGSIASELNLDTKHKDISGTRCNSGIPPKKPTVGSSQGK